MDALLHDARYAFRRLRRSPWFAAAAILTLALGIGANTAMVSVLNVLVLRPLAVKDPHQLIAASGRNDRDQLVLTLITSVTELERTGPFASVCAINDGRVSATDVGGTPTQSVIALVTGNCFEVFGVPPILGRTITNADAPIDAPGSPVTVISHGFWTRAFGADPNVIGKTMRIDGVQLTVIGVMPPRFGGLRPDGGMDAFVPNYTVVPRRPDRPSGAAYLLGRLKPDVSFEQAVAELDSRWPSLLEAIVPATLSGPERAQFLDARVRVERMAYGLWFMRDQYARPVTIVLGLTAALLLLACVNLGGLWLSRVASRTSELATQRALGASRARLMQQTLLESLAVAAAGAVLAIPISFAGVGVLSSFVPRGIVDRPLNFSPDTRVLLATGLCAIAAGVMVSVVPMRLSGRSGAVTFGWDRTIAGALGRWTRGLLVAQVALSIVLLIGATILARSLYLLQHTNLGVRTDNRLTVRVMPLPDGYRGIDNATYYPALLDDVRSLPGVRGVGMARLFPRVSATLTGTPIRLLGDPDAGVRAQMESASPEFFDVLGVPLLAGRMPAWTDRATTQQVAVVSESLARQLHPSGDVIGRRVAFGSGRADQDVVIVGVVGNISLGNRRQGDFPIFYRPTLQAGLFANYPSLVVETDGDALRLAAPIRATVRKAGREYAHEVDLLRTVFDESPSAERMSATLAGGVAALAVMLAFIGIYSALAYSVSRRTREIGVRVALGASQSGVTRMVMAEGLRLTLVGTALGIPVAIAAARVLRTLMFGVTEFDPAVLLACATLFALLGACAGLVPARRAANVDPAVALRAE
jgi:predicted permease